MFYSQFILAKKGPLGTIWIAAHLERKLRKNQVADTDIGVSVDSILFPEVPIALRLSSHLLLGVVRIYSKKVSYLFDDCSEALLKVKQAFRSTAVDLPPEQSKAPYHSITLPETFDLDDFELPDNEVFQGNFVDHHVSTKEQITLQDTMDGVSFPTSQFGPDERFGDGDASQIGLDLDEELFMDMGDAAGTSGIFVGTDAGPQASTKESSSSKGNEHDDVVSDPPLGSTTHYFSIQAPSTPGLTEEPNLPSSKEELQVSDDHMDEDHNPSELAAKVVAGTASSPIESSDMGVAEFRSNGTLDYMDEKDKENIQPLGTESLEFISSGFAQPAVFSAHLEATNGQQNVKIIPNSSLPLESERIMDVQGCDTFVGNTKTDLNGREESKTSDGPAILGTAEAVANCSENQNSFQSCLNLENAETFEPNVEKPSAFATPVLQVCSSKVSFACAGVNNVLYSSNLPAQDDGRSFKITRMEETTNVSQICTNVEDEVEATSNADQIAHEVSCVADSNFEGKLDNLTAEDNLSEKENNSQLSDFPHPEVLLCMPDFPAAPSHNVADDSTPGKVFFSKDGDATDENLISGRKRSFTESTLTVQSYNSVESPGGAQFKGTVESIPDDNDLLSSILAGRKSTTFKMKPTPPVPDTSRAKRQRTAVRSVAHKRKVLVDDSTVLHGDTIRQQLTSTEDIRRVRKKAPCTHLEVWVLQKQFLEDEIFSEPVFTGMFAALRSLNTEAFDLGGIRIVKDNGNNGASEADISTRSPTLGEEIEAVGTLVPSTADISSRPVLNGETEAVESFVSSSAGGEGLQGSGGKLLETPNEQESALVVDGDTPLKAGGDELVKEMLQFDGEKASLEFDDTRTLVGGEAIGAEPLSSVSYISEANCTSTYHIKVDSPSFDKSSDVIMSMNLNESGHLLDQRFVAQCTIGDASTVEGVLGLGTQDQVVEDGVSEKINLDERSGSEHILEKREGLDVNLVMGNCQDTCSLPVHNSSISESVTVDHSAGRASDQVGDCRQDELGIANKDGTFDSDLRDDGCCLTSVDVNEQLKLDSSVEADLSSQKTTLIESEDRLFWEDDSKIVTDSTPILPQFIDIGNTDALRTDAMEHDTDFLNVDDDDVVEDYESDMPDPEERRVLDNSGWSSRTRAVANYLQVLFEKEYDQDKKVVSLENLLAGKTRKEASRMFFETLVLKTKDYIQAEQESSFCDVKIKPRGKLLKSEF